MVSLYYFVLKTLAINILSSAFIAWFEDTRLGIWTYSKINSLLEWASEKYKLEQLKKINRFYNNYPEIAARLDAIEQELKNKK